MAQTILVVDNDPVQRRRLETAISRSGMTVVTAPGGQPALDLINEPRGEQIALMLLDLIMPDMGGLEVLAKLRPTNPDLPVIMLTAKGGIDSAVEAMRDRKLKEFGLEPVEGLVVEYVTQPAMPQQRKAG